MQAEFNQQGRFTIMRMLARVAKLADAKDLKSFFAQAECGFKSRPGHQLSPKNLVDPRQFRFAEDQICGGGDVLLNLLHFACSD